MTPTEWIECNDPIVMLREVHERLSERKLRLLGCACVRLAWYLLTDKSARRAVEVTEEYVDYPSKKKQALHLAAGRAKWALQYASDASRSAIIAAFHVADHAITPFHDRIVESILQVLVELRSIDPKLDVSQAQILRDVTEPEGTQTSRDPLGQFGKVGAVVGIANAIYASRSFEDMPVLADALEEAGVVNALALDHCRNEGLHVRGCWVLDQVMGKS